MLGRRVWADDDVQALAKNFLCVGDEIWFLDNVDSPGSKLWKTFVKNAAGKIEFGGSTKQGVYAMTPDGEFLAGHFARHEKAETLQLMRDALKRWTEIAAKNSYKPKPIPSKALNRTWGADGLARNAGGDAGAKAATILQVVVRDLPFKGERQPGPASFKGAFNQTWLDLTAQETQDLLPKGGGRTVVPDALFRKLAKDALLDFVRGQTPPWSDAAIQKAQLVVEPAPGGLRYTGEFKAQEGGRGFDAKLHGKAVWDAGANRFRLFELLAVGTRSGSTSVNFRFQEPPSPLAVAFLIEDQYDKPAPKIRSEAPSILAAPAVESKAVLAPDLLRERDQKLRALVEADLKAGRKTPFVVSVIGTSAEIVSLDPKGGAVKMASGGSSFDFLWADLSLKDKRNLALARVRPAKPAEDVALAAFYEMAVGNPAESLLRGLPAAESDALRALFKKP
ncbi:MAG TPA: hypothetical protein VF950_29305 [Planctomycetota bacterium]